MKFEVYNKGDANLKVAFFCKNTLGDMLSNAENIQKIADYNNIEIHLLDADFLDSGNSIRGSYEKHLLHDSDQSMIAMYDFILKYIVGNDIKVGIFFGSGYPWAVSFLDKFKKYTYAACYFGDDPEGCETTSKYYVKNFQYAFCGGVYFDKKTKISEQYLRWGARKSKFVPLGANTTKYATSVNDFNYRNVDVVYVGGAYLKKIIRMFKLKKHFGERMLIYGRGWNYHGKNIFKKIIVKMIKGYYKISEINELPADKLVDLYQKTKIGFNMHMSYGPSNLRMYELPMNGVMQICDCEDGLKELYEINKEVVTYESVNDAIRKIEYYLKNDKERIKIAKAGYERAKNNYKIEQSFRVIISEIKNDTEKNFKYL